MSSLSLTTLHCSLLFVSTRRSGSSSGYAASSGVLVLLDESTLDAHTTVCEGFANVVFDFLAPHSELALFDKLIDANFARLRRVYPDVVFSIFHISRVEAVSCP